MLELKSVPVHRAPTAGLVDKPPQKVNPPPLRRHFLTLANVRTLLAANPGSAKRLRPSAKHTVWRIAAPVAPRKKPIVTCRAWRKIAIHQELPCD